jgi:hypothetical protein
MTEARRITIEEVRRVGDAIGVDWSRFALEQFPAAWMDYYEGLDRMERQAERDWYERTC